MVNFLILTEKKQILAELWAEHTNIVKHIKDI